ncbi:MAG TPA: HEAT repeat domain-containing protein [bacterium]|nr:HEAT repeat domain-containing protein [bacterium]
MTEPVKLTDRKNMRLAFVETLSYQLDNTQAVERLLKYLTEGEDEVRLEAVRILSMSSHPRVPEALAELLDDANAALREQALKSLVRLAPRDLPRLLERGLTDASPWVRLVAVRHLPQVAAAKLNAIELLLARLADDSADVAAQAVISLSQLGDKRVVRPLFESMRSCRSVKVQARVVEALAKLDCPDLIEMLYERLWPNAHLTLRIALVRALGALGEKNERFRVWLAELVGHDDPFVRANAITALACNKLPVIEKIISALRDRHELVVRAAQEALAALAPTTPPVVALVLKALEDATNREPGAPAPAPVPQPGAAGATQQLDELARALDAMLCALEHPGLGQLVRKLIKSPNKVVTDRLVAIIEQSGYPAKAAAIATVRRACELPHAWQRYQLVTLLNSYHSSHAFTSENRVFRLNLIDLLARIKARPALATLVAMLPREQNSLRIAVIHALGEIGSERAVEAISRFSEDGEWLVRVNVALALGKIACADAYPVLVPLANDPHPWVRFNAVEAIRKLKGINATDLFLDRTADPDEKVRATAVAGLGIVATREHFDIISRLLEDPDDRVRANTVEALAFMTGRAINEHQLKQALFGLLADQHHRVRANAALALYPVCKDDVVKMLKQMLYSGDRWERAAAVYVLGEIGDVSAAGLLVEMLYDEDSRVRLNTVKALSKVKSDDINRLVVDSIAVVEEKILQSVGEALDHEEPDPGVRADYYRDMNLPPSDSDLTPGGTEGKG